MKTRIASPRLSRFALAVVAAAAVSGCDDLPVGDKTSPYYWSELFQDMYADELVVGELEPGPGVLAEPRAVLLITGVTIDAEWFGPITARLERDGFVPYLYVPPELLSGSLFQNAEDLDAIVDQVREQSGQDKIDILAECTGGVIARHYIQSLGGDEKVSRLVTFVSPHNGIDKAPMAAAIAGWPALTDLSPGSDFLKAVNGAPLPESVPVTSIYTCSDEYIQPWQGSVVPGATNIGLCGEFVGHFQTFYDPAIYLIMHEALTAPIPGEAVDEPGADPAGEPLPSEPSDPSAEPLPSDPSDPSDPAADPQPADPAPADPEQGAVPGQPGEATVGAEPVATGSGPQGSGASEGAPVAPEGTPVAAPEALPTSITIPTGAAQPVAAGCSAGAHGSAQSSGRPAVPGAFAALLGVLVAVARRGRSRDRLTSAAKRASVSTR